MIRYSLQCRDAHQFESWFANSDSFDRQAADGLISCPICASRKVSKAIMAPAVRSLVTIVPAPQREGDDKPIAMALLDERQMKMRELARAMRREVEAHTVDVGSDFPRIAREIHDGAEVERPIRGRASLAEARALIEDGIGVMPLPMTPDDLN